MEDANPHETSKEYQRSIMNKQAYQVQVCFQNERNIYKYITCWMRSCLFDFSFPNPNNHQTTKNSVKAPATNGGFRTPSPMIPNSTATQKIVIHFGLCKNDIASPPKKMNLYDLFVSGNPNPNFFRQIHDPKAQLPPNDVTRDFSARITKLDSSTGLGFWWVWGF